MGRIWMSGVATIDDTTTGTVEINGFVKSLQGYKIANSKLTPDGDDLRLETKGVSDVIYMNIGGTDEFKIDSSGGSNV